MGFLGGLIKTAINVATLPIDVTADVFTGGEARATERKMKKIDKDLEEV